MGIELCVYYSAASSAAEKSDNTQPDKLRETSVKDVSFTVFCLITTDCETVKA